MIDEIMRQNSKARTEGYRMGMAAAIAAVRAVAAANREKGADREAEALEITAAAIEDVMIRRMDSDAGA